MKEYKLWLDMAKGYGMLAIIMGHLYHMTGKAVFYLFHIPLFIFLAGYTFHPKDDFKEFFKKKVKRFLIPYFGLGLIVCIVNWFCIGDINILSLKNEFIAFLFQQRYLVMWFLTMLFILEIVLYFILKNPVNIKKIIIPSILIYILGRIYFYYNADSKWIYNIDVCFTAQFWFILGVYLANSKLLEKDFSKMQLIKQMIICFLGMIVLGGLNYKITGMRFDMYANSYCLPFVTEIATSLGILGVIKLSRLTEIGIVQYVGKHSMFYMMIHYAIIEFLQVWLFPKYMKILDNFLGTIITFVLCLIVGKIIIEIKEKWKEREKRYE